MSTASTSNEGGICPTHFLTELTSLDDLSFPTNSSKRIKFTCISASPRNLLLGTSTGTVYVFSRFAARNRNKLTQVPVHVFTTKDGPVNRLLVSNNEELVAAGSDSGRVSIAALGQNKQPANVIHTVAGDARKPDKVTSLCWSLDSKVLYVGHTSGVIHLYQLGVRSVFRSAFEVLASFEGEVVQLDSSRSRLLISTTTASYVFDMEDRKSYQIGKKSRNGKMGACFLTSRDLTVVSNENEFLVAARPNGRLWESNQAGVVYRTHQFRQSKLVPRSKVVSYRGPFSCLSMVSSDGHMNQDVQLSTLQRITVESDVYILTVYGSRVLVFDVESSRIVLLSELDSDILDCSVCGADIFVLLAGASNLRKFTLFSRQKVIEKLQLKSLHIQAAQFILFCSKSEQWPAEIINKAANALGSLSRKKDVDRLREDLYRLIEKHEKSQESLYDNCGLIEKKPTRTEDTPLSILLPSGVHRVQAVRPESSGYEDDFIFQLTIPLRERSKSSPCMESSIPTSDLLTKRSSVPLTQEEVVGMYSRNETPDIRQKDILMKAKQLLDSEAEGKVVESDSLRTLLQLESPETLHSVEFVPTVTVRNAAKALAELAIAIPVDSSQHLLSVDRRTTVRGGSSGRRVGPRIIKPVRPRRSSVKLSPPIVPRSPVSRVEVMTLPAPPIQIVASHSSLSATPVVMSISETNSNIIQENAPFAKAEGEPNSWNDDENNIDTVDSEWLQNRLSTLMNRDITTNKNECSGTQEKEGVALNTCFETKDVNNTSTTSPYGPDHCNECRTHRSWPVLSLLGTECRRVTICEDRFSTGAVPCDRFGWKTVLELGIQAVSEQSKLCLRCGTAINEIATVIGEGWRIIRFVPETVRMNVEKIKQKCASIEDDKLKQILFGFKEHVQMPIENSETDTLYNYLDTKRTESAFRFTQNEADKNVDYFSWLSAIDLKLLLALACIALGQQEIISILKESPMLREAMRSEDWSAMVALSAREQGMKKNKIGKKAILDVLELIGLSTLLSVDIPQPGSLCSIVSPCQTSSPVCSWVIDSNSQCPICTLTIKTDVGGMDLGVTSQICGHSYHIACLSTKVTGCIACRHRVRKSTIHSRGGYSSSRL